MAQNDWSELGGSLAQDDLARAVVEADVITPPSGGGDYVFGYNSLNGTVTGAHGMYCALSGFAPTGPGTTPAGGTSIRGAVRRVASPGDVGFAPFLFACCQGGPPTVNDVAYLLGLSDAAPYTIMLAKAAIVSGLVADASPYVLLAESSAEYSIADGLWHHLRLDCIVEPNGSVRLRAYANDLALHPIDVPGGHAWTAIPGFPALGVVDDNLRITTASAPLWGGYCGFAFSITQALNRRGAFDGLEAKRLT